MGTNVKEISELLDRALQTICKRQVELSANQYQRESATTAVYPGRKKDTMKSVNYLLHGLTGEAGETANKFKKLLREDREQLTDDDKLILMDELGDVLWYSALLADELGFSLECVMQYNRQKLSERAAAGTLKSRELIGVTVPGAVQDRLEQINGKCVK